MGRLHRRDGVLVDQLDDAVALEKHAEQIEGRNIALEHDAVDQEHRHRIARFVHRRKEYFLQEFRACDHWRKKADSIFARSIGCAGITVEIACL